MRNITPALQAHFGLETTSIATIWKLTRRDGVVLGFTDAVADLTLEGADYLAATGFTPSDVALKGDFSVSNLELDGVLDAASISEGDLLAGKYDYAEVLISLVNYMDLSQGSLVIKRGWLGEVSFQRNQFVAEVRGLSQKLQQNFGEVFSPGCRANLGDARCKVALAGFSFSGVVSSVVSQQIFKCAALTQSAGYFSGGQVNWSSGANVGLQMEVKDFLNGQLSLVLPMPHNVQIGDGFTVIAGCDKAFSTCLSKFNNGVNFRGEPHVPGMDAILQTSGTFR